MRQIREMDLVARHGLGVRHGTVRLGFSIVHLLIRPGYQNQPCRETVQGLYRLCIDILISSLPPRIGNSASILMFCKQMNDVL